MSYLKRAGQFIAYIIRSTLWSLTLLLALYTLALYALLYWLPTMHWVVSMLLITLPLAWVGNVVVGLVWLGVRPWRAVLPLLVLLAGFLWWPRTLALNGVKAAPAGAATFGLLSFNISELRVYEIWHYRDDTLKYNEQEYESYKTLRWVVEHPSDIKCFQEYVNATRYPGTSITRALEEKGLVYSAYLRPPAPGDPERWGKSNIATFSRYPIVRQERILLDESSNGILWADIALPSRDTVRVINIHLKSMGIRVKRLLNDRKLNAAKRETHNILSALREGFVARHQQMDIIESLMAESPYPVIVSGDFNDTPYSVVYERLRRRLRNAFEDAGRGFGFTLKIAPYFVRIDNQFYDAKAFEPLDFRTYRDQKNSDHFPIAAWYVVK